MKCFRECWSRIALVLLTVCLSVAGLRASLPAWLQNVEASSEVEQALFRLMGLPSAQVMARRSPREARPALSELIKGEPNRADLYSLRALQDEQQLDFAAAEADWKQYAQRASDRLSAQIDLANFYERRLRPNDEIEALSIVAKAGAAPGEELKPASEQRSWQAFERVMQVIQSNALPEQMTVQQYQAWTARYPKEAALYSRWFGYVLEQKDYSGAAQVIAQYRKQFPQDDVFPVKGEALLDYRRGSVEQGLAVYERSFQPLWPPELVAGYFDLLKQTHRLRKYLDAARTALNANPDDLNALARIFYYYQQQGNLEAAQRTIAEYRLRKEERKAAWSAREVYTLAQLLYQIHSYPEAARYYYALYNSQGMPDAQEKALTGLADILLSAPEQNIRLGSADLSMYQDIGTLDTGPGFLNGILSLVLNTTSPAYQYTEEENRAVPYFHRARAAELLALIDKNFPKSPQRAELHLKLLSAYAEYGESDAVIRHGKDFLATFPAAAQRTTVSLLMADAYARQNKTADEFAIYDAVLAELANNSQHVPLGAQGADFESAPELPAANESEAEEAPQNEEEANPEGEEAQSNAQARLRKRAQSNAFNLQGKAQVVQAGPRSVEYARVLERYLGRLVAMKQIPQALAVLRKEVERNPNDPGLYERLARFLEQNRLGAQQEEVYRRAIEQFHERAWYEKLARFYIREKRAAEFEKLGQEVTRIFSGTDLEGYFTSVGYNDFGWQLYIRVNLYAHQRFPHNLVFVRNLLNGYASLKTPDWVAWEKLLREHWFEDDSLRAQFFEFLSRTGKLQNELNTLVDAEPNIHSGQWDAAAQQNPLAVRFVAEAQSWRSHYEDSAPAWLALAKEFPADADVGRAATSVYRSLAYFEPRDTDIAVGVQKKLVEFDPSNRDSLALVGDIYADRQRYRDAAPYWNRMAEVRPGEPGAYLEPATVFWDYFDFANAKRLLEEGRAKLGNPALFAYEEGAVYENEREYPKAVQEYVKGALAGEGGSSAEARLLQLARRPATRDLVEQATVNLASDPNPTTEAVNLRISVLEAQNRKKELQDFLMGVVDRATTFELVESLEALAQQRSLEAVQQRALERQATLTTDPVNRLELRYRLVRFYEGKKDMDAAQRNVEALYQENPKILGVVRATVDFYWRTKQYDRGLEVLQQAARDSYPELKKNFTFEAARKATEAGKFDLARQLLKPLMDADPFNLNYSAAMADIYARSGDDAGLKQFYLAEIEQFRNAPNFSPDYKTQIIAGLRRGLIPALTRSKDYAGAVDQYIEIINKYPDDAGLTTEAASYAERYGRKEQLLGFYVKTVAASPKDSRWPVVVARIDTQFEDYPAAVDAYGKAIAIRPDRVDLFTARAGLLERLMRFDEAVADYQRLYELAYKDPKWMEKVAEVRARQQRTDDAVEALRLALIEGRPENAANYLAMATRLEGWGLLTQARTFAEQGLKLAGDDLLAAPENHGLAQFYIRLMTRLRQQDAAYKRIQAALEAASRSPNSPAAVAQQVQRKGLASVTDQQWRQQQAEQRRISARAGFAAVLRDLGTTVNQYFTPEEKAAFVNFLAAERNGKSPADVEAFYIPAAQNAVIPELEARWRYELVLAKADQSGQHYARLVALQTQRLRFKELGGQLEAIAQSRPRDEDLTYLQSAAQAYRSGGDYTSELRVLGEIFSRRPAGGVQERYFELLMEDEPLQMVQLASARQTTPVRDAAADYIVGHAESTLSQNAVQARSQGRPAVWAKAYTGLVGLYFADDSPAVNDAFRDALNDVTIGERLAKPLDRDQKLAGDVWFYYGSRYGEYLGTTGKNNADDFLPAVLEHSPGSAGGYLVTAEYYADAGELNAAVADYLHYLELNPENAGVRDRLAVIYWKQNNRDAAVAEWHHALAILSKSLDRVAVPETFWSNFTTITGHLGTRKIFASFRPEIDALLRAYMRKNGSYRSAVLLSSAYQALGDPAAGVSWMLDLAALAPQPSSVLAQLVSARWIPLSRREPFYDRMLQIQQEEVAKSQGLAKDYAQQNLRSWQLRWLNYLLETRQYQRAQDAINGLSKETRQAMGGPLVRVEVQVASALNTLEQKLESYRAAPEQAPDLETLRQAAKELLASGKKPEARKVLEYVFGREIAEHKLTAANLLGLAEIRIDAGDLAGGMDLLRRATLVVGEPFENLDAAANVLHRTGHPAEEAAFLADLLKAKPWDNAVRVRLAEAQIAAGKDADAAKAELIKMASGSDVAYETRTQAAEALAGKGAAKLGSQELDMLAGTAAATSANQPYFYAGRLKAAQAAPDDAARVVLLRAALEDAPQRDPARLALFRAADGAHQYSLAVAAIEPLIQGGLLTASAPPQPDDLGAEEPESPETSPDSWKLERIPVAQRAAIAATLAADMAELTRWQDAASYYRTAISLERAPARRTELNKKLTEIRAIIKRRRDNEARQPRFHDALEQDRVVRPRLVARAASPPAAATPKRRGQ